MRARRDSNGSSPGATCAIPSKKSHRTLIDRPVAAACSASLGYAGGGRRLPRLLGPHGGRARRMAEARPLAWIGYVADRAARSGWAWAASSSLLGVLFSAFTVFTALSIFGVFLGTGGADHRAVGHVGVRERPEDEDPIDQGRRRHRDAATTARSPTGRRWRRSWPASPASRASMAYVEAEVIVKHATNAAGMGDHPARHRSGARAARARHRAHAEGGEASPTSSTRTRSPTTSI